jgi:hypothetical protein
MISSTSSASNASSLTIVDQPPVHTAPVDDYDNLLHYDYEDVISLASTVDSELNTIDIVRRCTGHANAPTTIDVPQLYSALHDYRASLKMKFGKELL